ncbi:hypothetical protein ATCC90586_002400 [Pythium insidiosum]|nr:hypothetical protein ATCC90586_002400 [Pythium insidiosum]
MRKIMATRGRVLSIRNPSTANLLDVSTRGDVDATDDDCLLLRSFVAAIEAREKEQLVTIVTQSPRVVSLRDEREQVALHLACALVPNYFYVDLLEMMVQADPESPAAMDEVTQRNPSVTSQALGVLVNALPAAAAMCDKRSNLALHYLCRNPVCDVDMLRQLGQVDTYHMRDEFGHTPLHCLAKAQKPLKKAALLYLLQCHTDAVTVIDTEGRSVLHWVCEAKADLLWLFLERASTLVRDIDMDGKTPLHHLCANKALTAVTLEILADACPSAAIIADKEMRLPIQYLVDNPSSPPETTALLISGPSSYRLRYDFLSVIGGHAISFLQNHKLVYVQTNLAMDSKASKKVLIQFFSSASALEHDRSILARINLVAERLKTTETTSESDFSILIYDDFEDAKRRVSIRSATVVAPEDQIGVSLQPVQLFHLINSVTDDVIGELIDQVDLRFRGLLKATLRIHPAQRWTIDRLLVRDWDLFDWPAEHLILTATSQKKELLDRTEEPPVDSTAYDCLRSQLQRIAETEILGVESQRSAKHTADQLEFLKKEHRTLRSQLLAYKTTVRTTEETCEAMRQEVSGLRGELSRLQRQRQEAQDEARVLARNHQSMTQQLHTTMQMLVSLVPLAKRVYGSGADEFLSTILSQAAGSESTSLSTIDISSGDAAIPTLPRRRPSAVQLVKQQLQRSVLAQGCLHTWAHSSPPSTVSVEAQQEWSRSTSREEEDDATPAAACGNQLEEEADATQDPKAPPLNTAATANTSARSARGGSGSVNGGSGGSGGRGGGRGGGGGGRREPALNLDEAFCMHVHSELQALVEDGTRQELSFPKDLDNHQRRYIHSMVEKYGLFSKSSGKGEDRFIHVAKVKKNASMKQVSLRLPAMKANASTMAWLPPAIQQYLTRYPIEDKAAMMTASSTSKDAWCAGDLTASWSAHQLVDRRKRLSPPLFKPLRMNSCHEPVKQPARSQLPVFNSLPVHSYRSQILEYVDRHQVIVVSGDTGCGKSTQIPQFLLDDAIAKGTIGETRIICSQPRRLSAISLAERVAKERASSGGGPMEVGHAIRFDSSYDAKKSKLIFCTTGTLLKWLNSDPLALGFSHLILDEVHERDQYTDFLLILLKSNILRKRPDLKVILMSATIQVEKFAEYFQPEFDAPILEMVGGRCFPVTTLYLEDVLGLIHHANTSGGVPTMAQYRQAQIDGSESQEDEDRDSGDAPVMDMALMCPLCQHCGFEDEESFGMHVAMCFGEPPAASAAPQKQEEKRAKTKKKPKKAGKTAANPRARLELGAVLESALHVVGENVKTSLLENYVRQENALSRDQSVDYTLVLQLLHMIEQVFPIRDVDSQGAILVFLPGWEEISYLERELSRSHMTSSLYEIALLHSRLSAQEQRKAFIKPRPGKRKLILATNIAETSLTIEDVVFVIDCGKSKQAHALATTSSSSFVMGLQTTWVAKANCVQRMGRAGRVRPGVCFRLFSQTRYETSMKEFMVPELLTTPLEELMLHVTLLQFEKKLQISDAKSFLMQAMDPPSETAIDASLERLRVMGALGEKDELTLLGWHLAHVCDSGVSVHMGKLLLWSHIFGSFEDVVQTTCALSGYRDPFLNFLGMAPEETQRVEASKLAFVRDARAPIDIQSDHFVLLLALQSFLQFHPRAYTEMETFCRRNMLHRPTLEQIVSIYRQLQNDLEVLGMARETQMVEPRASRQRRAGLEPWDCARLAPYFMSLGAGLYPNLLVAEQDSTSRNWTSKEKVKVRLDSSSLLQRSGRGNMSRRTAARNGGTEGSSLDWLVYHEMMQSERMRVAKNGTKLPTELILLLLVGNSSQVHTEQVEPDKESVADDQAESLAPRWHVVLDDWIVFELDSAEELGVILTLRARLQAAFTRHLDWLHESHLQLHTRQSMALSSHPSRGESVKREISVPSATTPRDPMRELWRQHDVQLVQALNAWVAADLQRNNY